MHDSLIFKKHTGFFFSYFLPRDTHIVLDNSYLILPVQHIYLLFNLVWRVKKLTMHFIIHYIVIFTAVSLNCYGAPFEPADTCGYDVNEILITKNK